MTKICLKMLIVLKNIVKYNNRNNDIVKILIETIRSKEHKKYNRNKIK